MGVRDLLKKSGEAETQDPKVREAVDALEFFAQDSNAPHKNLSDVIPTLDAEIADTVTGVLALRKPSPTDRASDSDIDVRIGLVRMDIPPSDIRVSEIRYNDSVQGLRTTSSTLAKTGRGRIQIELMMDFPNRDLINTQLRQIIAQFRAVPFLPLESRYIYNRVKASAAMVDPQTIATSMSRRDSAMREYNACLNRMISSITTNPAMALALHLAYGIEADRLRVWLRGKTADQILDVCGKALREFDRRWKGAPTVPHSGFATSIPEGLTWPRDQDWTKVPSTMSNLQLVAKEANDALDKVYQEQAALSQIGIPDASKRPVIHVINAGLDIQTVPGERDSLKARMVLVYLNEDAYVSQILYRDVLGNPTPDILDCPAFEYYVRSRFLEPATNSKIIETGTAASVSSAYRYLGKLKGDYSGDFIFDYPTPVFEEVSGDEPSDRTSYDAKHISSGYTAPTKNGEKTKLQPVRATLNTEAEGLTPLSVRLYLENSVAFQPISGAMYGAAQHIGSVNARIDLIFSAVGDTPAEHDPRVAAVQRRHQMTAQVAQMGGERARLNTKFGVENDLLALVGVRNVQIDGITTKTIPGEIYSSEIRLNLTEYTIAQSKRERVRLARPDMALSALKATLEFAVKKVNHCLTKQFDKHLYRFFKVYGELSPGGFASIVDPGGFAGIALASMSAAGYHRLRRRVTPLSEQMGAINEEVLATALFEDDTVKASITSAVKAEDRPVFPGKDKAESTSDCIQGGCHDLAVEMLTFWTSWRHEGPSVIRSSRFKDVTIEATPKRYLDAIMEVLRRPGHAKELDVLEDLTDYATRNFAEVRNAIKEDQVDARRICNYPDLNLPTYGEMLLGMMQLFKAEDVIHVFDHMNTLTPGPKVKALLKRFIPTYRDLGRIPPLSQDAFDPAYRLIDYVDPDFYFFHVRMSPTIDSVGEFFKDEAKQLFHPSSNTFTPDAEEQDLQREADAARLQALRGMSEGVAKTFIYPANDKGVIANLDLVPGKKPQMEGWRNSNGAWSLPGVSLPYGNTPDYMYKPSPLYEKLVGKFVHDDPHHLESLRQETLKSIKDDQERMIRAFPTFHLFFVEEDSEEWGYWDDIYSYNALISLSLSEHKFEPKLLEFTLMNTTGSLDRLRSRMEDPDKVAQDAKWHDPLGKLVNPRKPLDSPDVEPGTGEPREMKRFYLQVGTHIKFCLGYGSNTEDLEVKFTGQVVEIEYGDITRVLCQGYKSQLTVPLNKGAARTADPYEVVRYVMQESPTANFGAWSPYEVGLLPGLARDGSLINKDSMERLGWNHFRKREDKDVIMKMKSDAEALGLVATTIEGWSDISGLSFEAILPTISKGVTGQIMAHTQAGILRLYEKFSTRLADFGYTRKMANVYLPRHSALGKAVRWCREFIISARTGFEVLMEMTRYLPGYVCDVRPYDHNATLYFGKPEQRYFYTSERQDEEREWQEFQGHALAVRIGREVYAFQPVVNAFERSRYYDATKYDDEVEAYRRTLDGERTAYKLPGHAVTAVTSLFMPKPLAMGEGLKTLGERYAWQQMTYYESPDRLRDLQQVESYITERHVEVLARMAFDKFSNDGDAGTMLTSLPDWRDILSKITAKTPGTSLHFLYLRNEVFHVSEDQPTFNIARDTNAGVIDKHGAQIDRAKYETAVEEILANIGPWKAYLRGFRNYIQHKIAIGEADIFEQLYVAAKEAESEEYNPRTKRFRDHHYVDSSRDIIKNGILATKGQMANGVMIKHPKDIRANPTWRTHEHMIDQNIDPGEKKIRVVREWNAEDVTKLYSCTWSNLAEAVRPMYRGSLILRGKERIKPHDVVWITDTYENIHGPIEVERVISHFNVQVGYTTTIVPQLLAIPRSASSWMDSVAAGSMRMVCTPDSVLQKAAGTAGLSPSHSPAGKMVAAIGGAVGEYMALQEETGTGIWGNLTGKGRYANMRTPVDIMPLMRNGIPWTAGLRGWGDGDWKVRFFKKWCSIKRGLGVVRNVGHKVVRDFFHD